MDKTLKSELKKAFEEAAIHIEEAKVMPLTADSLVAIQRRIDCVMTGLSWIRQTVARLREQSKE